MDQRLSAGSAPRAWHADPEPVVYNAATHEPPRRRVLALSLIQEHKLHDWSFGFDRARRRFGSCNFIAKRITLSAHLVHLNDEALVRDTILHEIAHALAGPGIGHGEVWQATAKAIGCSSMRCYGDEVVQPAAKFKGTCPGCGKTILRMRRKRISCGLCSASFDVRFLFVWSRG